VSSEFAQILRLGRSIAVRIVLLAVTTLAVVVPPRPAIAQAIKGEISVTVENGFARFVLLLSEEIETKVRVANNILTITFEKPVDIAVDRVAVNSSGYVAAARRDPDRKAVRFALARKVSMNSIAAAERLFVDLLPEGWSGMMPGLPREVIEELARRARDAERKTRQQRAIARQAPNAPIRVRVATLPTFTRFIFEFPELVAVSADNSKDKLTLTFDGGYKFDLADAVAALPPMVSSINSELERETATVRFHFSGIVDVRTFREDNSYILDVISPDAKAEGNGRSDDLAAVAAELAARAQRPDDAEEPDNQRQENQRQENQRQDNQRLGTPPASGSRPAPTAPATAQPAPSVPNPTRPARFSERPVPAQPQSQPQAPQPQMPQPQAPGPAGAQPSVAPGVATANETEDERPTLPPPTARPAPPSAPGEGATPAPRPRATPVVSEPGAGVATRVRRSGDNVTFEFPFASATPAAVFRRGDTLWLVFGSEDAVAVAPLEGEIGRSIKGVTRTRARDAELVRIRLDRPMLVSAHTEGSAWNITLGPEAVEPTRPLALNRSRISASRSSISVFLDDARDLYRIEDPEAGDTLLVATALSPARGFFKAQDFVEFRVLPSTHGVVIQPLSDDLNAELAADKLVISRPTGLTLSAVQGNAHSGVGVASGVQRQVLDTQTWGFDRQADFKQRNWQLLSAAADASEARRLLARTDLARFYLARDMIYEAKAVLDVAIADQPPTAENPSAVVLRAVCNIMIGRAEMGLKDLASPFVGNQNDAPLWRALAYAKLGKWPEAREGFRAVEAGIGTLPLELQRNVMKEMIRAYIEVGDITGATAQLNEFEAIGIPPEFEPTMALLSGRLNEGLGRMEDARRSYQFAAESKDRGAAAQGRLREIVLRQVRHEIERSDAISQLETLAATWRGDATEIEALQMLGRAYTDEGRYRDAFQLMRTAISVHPNSEMTRRIQEEAASTFDSLFLAGKGDTLPAIDALAMFYDFRDLTPIGRRGDEMIRRLADRLVSVDLLSQAADLLKHQVDNRLQGAARAQVAARLAAIYLMDRKPDRALAALRATRSGELSNELRNQRLMLEARALSETGRHDVALEVVANVPGPEAIRLRADIQWAAKRWVQAAEQIELLYGERWREFEPLEDKERLDILRAAVGYALGDDLLGLNRFREKFAAKMGDGPDRRAFDVLTAPAGSSDAEFGDVARALRAADTLENFLRDLRARYPALGALPASRQRAAVDDRTVQGR
jgi:tetratricopeptide (TPR) repeat protein